MGVSIFGTVALTAMVVAYAVEKRSHWFVIVFAVASAAASAYALLIGAWPFAALEAIWAGIAAHRWRQLVTVRKKGGETP